MTQLEAILGELGLAPLWIQRDLAGTPAAGSVSQAQAKVEEEAPVKQSVEQTQPSGTLPSIAPGQTQSGGGSLPIASEQAQSSGGSPPIAPEQTQSDGGSLPIAPEQTPSLPVLDEAVPEPTSPSVPANVHSPASTPVLVQDLDWAELKARVASCTQCRLCEKRTQTVFGVGDEAADWMLIGEAPGEQEDKQGEPFVGQAGKLLDNMLRALSLARGQNVYIANVLKCRPPGNRNPQPDEVLRCEPYLKRQVELVKPKIIVALGRFAAQSLLKTNASISSLRGRVHEYEGVPVIVSYHPAYLLRSLSEKSKAWSDLCLARATYQRSGTSH